jgi:hypothetical protein
MWFKRKEEKQETKKATCPYIVSPEELFKLVDEYYKYNFFEEKMFWHRKNSQKEEYELDEGLYFCITKTLPYHVDTWDDVIFVNAEYSLKVSYRSVPLNVEETNVYLEKLVSYLKKGLEKSKEEHNKKLMDELENFRGVKN